MPHRNLNVTDEFVPVSPFKYLSDLIAIVAGLAVLAVLTLVSLYFVICYMDDNLPIEVYTFKAADTFITGGKAHIHLVGKRKRSCEISIYQQVIDVNGNVIAEKTIERPFNGSSDRDIDLEYPLDFNARAKFSGKATAYQQFRWKCPYNLVQKYVQPLELTKSSEFMLYANEQEYMEAQKKKVQAP